MSVEPMLTSSDRLAGKVALVTGAGSGIGAGVLRRFVDEGACVAAIGRNAQSLAEVTAGSDGRAIPIVADVTDPAACARAVQDTVEHFGAIDCVVSNAGVYDQNLRLSSSPLPVLRGVWDEVFQTNVTAAVNLLHAALPHLEASRGNIIFTGSLSSVRPGFGGFAYVASKHALLGLARQLSLELAGRVRVNSVLLGYVATSLRGAPSTGGGSSLGDPEDVCRRIPTGYAPRPDDAAGLYVTLASDRDSRMVTGAELIADSGQSLWGPPWPRS